MLLEYLSVVKHINIMYSQKLNWSGCVYPFSLTPLPYDISALEPSISRETLEYHHGKHHQTYVNKLNDLLARTAKGGEILEDVILSSFNSNQAVFNNAAQVWNHTFLWYCMSPNGGVLKDCKLKDMIVSSFGSVEKFKEEFKNAALTQFGSGWAWLVQNAHGLEILKTSNANTPLTNEQKIILTIDVWEHAYYIDYRNSRQKYVEVFLDELVNWEFCDSLLK